MLQAWHHICAPVPQFWRPQQGDIGMGQIPTALKVQAAQDHRYFLSFFQISFVIIHTYT